MYKTWAESRLAAYKPYLELPELNEIEFKTYKNIVLSFVQCSTFYSAKIKYIKFLPKWTTVGCRNVYFLSRMTKNVSGEPK